MYKTLVLVTFFLIPKVTHLIVNNMDKKDILIIALKVIIYACTAILAVLGVSAMTSCSTTKDVDIYGKTTIVATDTTYINHRTLIAYPKK